MEGIASDGSQFCLQLLGQLLHDELGTPVQGHAPFSRSCFVRLGRFSLEDGA